MATDDDAFPHLLSAISESDDAVELRQALIDAYALFGISRAYFVAPISRDVRISRAVSNIGLSWVWERQYRERLNILDPVPRVAMEKLAPVLWPDHLDLAALDPREKRYLKFASQHDLGRGVGVACFGPNGRSCFVGAVLDKDAPVPDARNLLRIQIISQLMFQRYCHLLPITDGIAPLSNRELEVLHWIGRGKSNSVIATLLGISQSSVDVYIRRLFAKLGVTDRTSASVKAVSLGLLISDDYEDLVLATGRRKMQHNRNRDEPNNDDA